MHTDKDTADINISQHFHGGYDWLTRRNAPKLFSCLLLPAALPPGWSHSGSCPTSASGFIVRRDVSSAAVHDACRRRQRVIDELEHRGPHRPTIIDSDSPPARTPLYIVLLLILCRWTKCWRLVKIARSECVIV